MSRKATRDRSGIIKIQKRGLQTIKVKCQDCGTTFFAVGQLAMPEFFIQGVAHCGVCGGILKLAEENII